MATHFAHQRTFPEFLDWLLTISAAGEYCDTKDAFHLYKDRSWKMYPRTDLHSTYTKPTQDKLKVILNDGSKQEISSPESGVKYLVDLHDFTMFIQTTSLQPGSIITHMVYSGARAVIEFAASSGYPQGSNVVTPPLRWRVTTPEVTMTGNQTKVWADVFDGVPPYKYEFFDSTGASVYSVTDSDITHPYNYDTSKSSPGDLLSIAVTDSAGHTIRQTIKLVAPAALHFSKDLASAASFNLNDTGHFEVQAAGGVPPYTYRWHLDADNHFANDDTNKLSVKFAYVGNNTLFATVMDSAGNVATSTTMTTTTVDPNQMTWTVVAPSPMTYGNNYLFEWSGGKAPYTISFHGATLTTTNDTRYRYGVVAGRDTPGWYELTVTDADNRRIKASVTVYGAIPKFKSLTVAPGTSLDIQELFKTSNWFALPLQNLIAGAFTASGGAWAVEPTDMHYTFTQVGSYVIQAGYYRQGDTTQVLVPSTAIEIPVTVTTTPTLLIDSQPKDATWKAGESHDLRIGWTGGTAPVVLIWEYSKAGQTWTQIKDVAGHISGATSSNLHIEGASASDAGHYRCLILDKDGNVAMTTPGFIITVQ